MKILLFFLAVLSLALFGSLVARAVGRQRRLEGHWPFLVQTPLSRVEQAFYHRLTATLPAQVVLAQVGLTRFLRVKKGRTWHEWHDRISERSVDYLICERDFTIIAAIELDDGAHSHADRIKVDATKSRALAAAGIPLIRWHVASLPDVETIRAVIDEIHRDRFGDIGSLTTDAVAPNLTASRIDASNDPTMFTHGSNQ